MSEQPYKLTSLTLFVLLFFASFTMYSQLEQRQNKFRIGGSVNVGFGEGRFTAGIAPSAVYDFNRYWSAGLGLSGNYLASDRIDAYTLGGSILTFFRPYQGLRLSAELEQLYVNRKTNNSNAVVIEEDYTYPALFLGIGYTTRNVTAGLKYDVLYDKNKSIYASALVPFVSIYF